MNTIKYILTGLLLVMLTGCNGKDIKLALCGKRNDKARHYRSSRKENQPEIKKAKTLEEAFSIFEQAVACEKSEDYKTACELYRSVSLSSRSSELSTTACTGAARCLLHMRKAPAALATISPLPILVRTEADRQQLALGGQALIMMQDYEQAEKALDKSLKGYDPELAPPAWCAAACANIAKCSLENDTPSKAAQMYRKASRNYALRGQLDEASECMDMAVSLEKHIAKKSK